MRKSKVTSAAVATGAAVAAGWASVAFACSPMPRVYSVLPESASPGSTVMVEGREVAAPAPVEIRWNGVRGEVLATATAGSDGTFSVPVRVPDVAPGVYSLTLVAPGVGVGRTAFEVTGSAASAPAGPAVRLWPSASDAAPATAPASNGTSTAGVALLSVGLVGLAAGTTVAVTRRRRVLAGPNR